MLTPKEIEDITKLAAHYAVPRGACVEALKAVQRSHGWVSDDDLHEVASILGMSPDELDGVATFYNLIFRRPVGRHVILICDSVSCWIMGYEALRDDLETCLCVKLGETTGDGRFTVLPIVCLGACDRAPVMMIDADLHTDLNPAALNGVLAKYR
jgi:NADH-quinone oxidoreductase subunit E